MIALLSLAISATLPSAFAHVALWDKGMFGLNWPNQVGDSKTNWGQNQANNPLRETDGYGVDQWFGHGFKGFPPGPGDFMILPAGGSYHGEVWCGRSGTTFRNPADTGPLPQYACSTEGPLHVANKFGQPVDDSKFGGTALAIAYTSNVAALQPNDMTVISVNHRSVWEREISYDIPAGLPPCPEGGCLCTWNWIHQSADHEGYGNEIYNNLYRCQVTGATDSSKVVQRGQVPRECASNPGNCVQGPKTPMYIYQAEGNNLPRQQPPPLYRTNWGFQNGAQNDIFGAGSSPAPTTYIANSYATPTTTKTTATAAATVLPTGWSEAGCVVDAAKNRVLNNGPTLMSDLTIEKCVASCASKGSILAGVQNGNECWCGSQANTMTAAPASACNTRCYGDPFSFCGGSYRMNIFRSPAAQIPATQTTATQTTATQTSTTQTTATQTTATQTPATQTPTTQGPATQTISTTATTGAPTPIASSAIPAGWSSLGCNVDDMDNRALDSGATDSADMTVALCLTICSGKGMPYAGVEYGHECWCGRTARIVPATSGCDSRCTGDLGVVCGGANRINIFRAIALTTSPSSSASSTTTTTTSKPSSTTTTATTAKPSSTTTTTPTAKTSSTTTTPTTAKTSSTTTTTTTTTSKPSSSVTTSSTTSSTLQPTPLASLPTGWRSLGCTVDDSTKRVLPGTYQNGTYSESTTSQTPQACMALCRSRGFTYAGVEYGRQCYCGKSATNVNIVTSGCNMPCPGDKSLACGGLFRMNLYAFTPSKVTKRDLLGLDAVTPPPQTPSEEQDRFESRRYPLPMRFRRPQ